MPAEALPHAWQVALAAPRRAFDVKGFSATCRVDVVHLCERTVARLGRVIPAHVTLDVRCCLRASMRAAPQRARVPFLRELLLYWSSLALPGSPGNIILFIQNMRACCSCLLGE